MSAVESAAKKEKEKANPCCAAWKEKYSKLQEGRKALREALAIVTADAEKSRAEIDTLKKAYETERARAESEKQEKEKELVARVSLEQEISVLKSEISSSKKKGAANAKEKKEIHRLKELLEKETKRADLERKRADVEKEAAAAAADAKGKKEINRLKELLEKERKRKDSERKRADVEKENAAEAWKCVEAEKVKLVEERKIASTEREKAEEYRHQMELLEEEVNEMKAKLVKFESEVNKESAADVHLENEISFLESELSLQQKGTADGEEKAWEAQPLDVEELWFAETDTNLLKELLDQEEVWLDVPKGNNVEAWEHVKAEKTKVEEAMLCADAAEKEAQEYRLQLEVAKQETDQVKSNIISERLKFEEDLKKETALRVCLENEISALKSGCSSLQANGSSDPEDKISAAKLLQDCASKAENDINLLKELLEEAKRRADVELKNAEAEKKSATEAWEHVKDEKAKVAEAMKLADVERVKAQQYLLQLEASKKEAVEAKAKLVSMTSEFKEELKKQELVRVSLENETSTLKLKLPSLEQKLSAEAERLKANEQNFQDCKFKADKEINELRKLLEQEKINLTTEKKNAELERKRAAKAWEDLKVEKAKADEARKRAGIEGNKAEDYKHRFEALKKEAREAKSRLVCVTSNLELAEGNLELEKLKVLEERKCAEAHEKKAMEESSHAIKISHQLKDARNRIEELQKELELSEEARKIPETEKQKTILEMNQVDLEMAKAGKLAEANEKIAVEEKFCADQLSHQIEEGRFKIQEMEKQIHQLMCSRNLGEFSSKPETYVKVDMMKVQLLRKELKLEKIRRKHAEQVVKFEMSRNSMLVQELTHVKMFLANATSHLDVLDKFFPSSVHGAKALEKVGDPANIYVSNLMRNHSGVEPFDAYSQRENEHLRPCFMAMSPSDICMHASGCSAPSLPVYGRNCSGFISGTDSKLESPLGGSNRILQSSDMNSRSTSFSDSQLVGSQETSAFLTSEKPVEEKSNEQATISGISDCVTKVWHNETNGMVPANNVNNSQSLDVRRVDDLGKKRRVPDGIESAECVHLEVMKLHPQVVDKPIVLRGVLDKHGVMSLENPRLVEPRTQLGSFSQEVGFQKKRKVSYQDEVNIQNLPKECELKKNNREVNEVLADVTNFDTIVKEDYMKLLDLDDSADEGHYRSAVKMPLSPTLPDIGFSTDEMLHMDKITQLDNNIHGGISDEINMMLSTRSKSGGQRNQTESGHDVGADVTYCVVLSSTDDCHSVSRVFYATRACMTCCLLDDQTHSWVRKVLHAFVMEERVSRKEKSCVIFTMLLLNFGHLLKGSGSFSNENFMSQINAFSQLTNDVFSDVETRRLLAEACGLDELLDLIEDFLLCGRVLLCMDLSSEALSGTFPIPDAFDNLDLNWCTKPATLNQLVVGSAILASICVVTDRIGFICEASYNILRVHGGDTGTILTILHVFTYVCGEKLFASTEYILTLPLLKSLVKHLEGELSRLSSPLVPSMDDDRVVFHPCAKCPFSDAHSVDVVASLLCEELDTLQSSSSSLSVKSSNYNTDENFCSLGDVLSSMELLACKMSWEWTRVNLVPKLLKLLETHRPDDFAVAMVVLLGQLGRLGISTNGYEDTGVENLRNSLSGFLRSEVCTRFPLPLQLATMTTLMGLLPFEFGKVMQIDFKPPAIASQSVVINHMRKWFSLLTDEQKTLTIGLSQSE